MNKKTMNILLCIDDFKWDYTRHCAVTILSLLETNKNHKIKIFIMSSCLSEENIKELKRIVKLYNQEIEFIIRDNIIPEEIKKSVINRRNLTWWTWYRLFFPLYIKNIDRLLYLDCDVLVTKDIEDIYNMDMKWKAIAWSNDITSSCIKLQEFCLDNYVNAGVLLFDVKKYDVDKINLNDIRIINDKYWNFIKDSDQDYLNVVFKNEILVKKEDMNYLVLNKFFNKWIDKAKMVHCVQKPYVQFARVPSKYVKLYYKYLNLTKWKNYHKQKDMYGILRLIYGFCVYLLEEVLWKKNRKSLLLFLWRLKNL